MSIFGRQMLHVLPTWNYLSVFHSDFVFVSAAFGLAFQHLHQEEEQSEVFRKEGFQILGTLTQTFPACTWTHFKDNRHVKSL